MSVMLSVWLYYDDRCMFIYSALAIVSIAFPYPYNSKSINKKDLRFKFSQKYVFDRTYYMY